MIDEKTLQTAANIAVVRGRLDLIINNVSVRNANMKEKFRALNAKAAELDNEFIDLILKCDAEKQAMNKAEEEDIAEQIRLAKLKLANKGKISVDASGSVVVSAPSVSLETIEEDTAKAKTRQPKKAGVKIRRESQFNDDEG
jgi:hypothetical protein